jgi:hypothetical protein
MCDKFFATVSCRGRDGRRHGSAGRDLEAAILTDWWQQVHQGLSRVQAFVDVCRASGWEPVAFINAVTRTDETYEKWCQRREEEVVTGIKQVAQVRLDCG